MEFTLRFFLAVLVEALESCLSKSPLPCLFLCWIKMAEGNPFALLHYHSSGMIGTKYMVFLTVHSTSEQIASFSQMYASEGGQLSSINLIAIGMRVESKCCRCSKWRKVFLQRSCLENLLSKLLSPPLSLCVWI